MKKFLFFILVMLVVVSCKERVMEADKTAPILEVAGKFLYRDEVDKVIPPNVTVIDSADIAERYIQNWVTDVLMYENAKRNVTDLDKINKLVEEYRKSLIIHGYEQALVAMHVNEKIPDKEILEFYNQYKSQILSENHLIKGLLLILPINAPQLNEVKNWVRSADTRSLEKIEKYSLTNAISFDYFKNWIPFSEVLKKMPMQVEDSKELITSIRFTETTDSTKLYLLTITGAIPAGSIEPYEIAKEKVANIILNKKKSDFIIEFEKSVYNDALKQGEINFLKK